MNFYSIRYISIILITTIAIIGCDSGISKEGELKKRIREAANDQEISAEEWSDLQQFAQNNDDLKNYTDCAALRQLVQTTTERKGVPSLPECNGGGGTTTTTGGGGKFNVYVENSASMFGYMLGATEFREALMDIPSRLVGREQTGQFFFINDQTYPATKEYRQFVEMLNKEKAGSKDYGNTAKSSNSKLDDMLQRVVNETIKQSSVGIFTSDCIFDVDGKRPQDELPNQKFKIKATMQKFQQAGDYGVLVLKFLSAFDGNYFDCKNGKTPLKGVKRPFYIWIFGKAEELRTFVKDYSINTVSGFSDFAFFYNSDKTAEKLYYSMLERTKAVGSFARPSGAKDRILAMESVRIDGDSKLLQVAVAVDFSKLPVSESYITNSDNWQVKSDKDDPFSVVSIEALSPAAVHNNDKRFTGTATHILLLQTSKLASGTQRLTIELKKELPAWVTKSGSEDDTNIKAQLDKTFGLTYLLEGVNEAFDEPGSAPVHCKLKLELTK